MIKPIQGTLKFIRVERNQGTSAAGKDYDVSTLTVSDGDESFPVSIEGRLVSGMQAELRKGDFVELTFQASAAYKGTRYNVIEYKKVQALVKA